jgi:hypothetical protein
MGIQAFTLLLRFDLITPELESWVLTFCQSSPNIVGCGRRFGEWNYELQIEVSELSDLQQIRFEFRRMFGVHLVDSSLLVIDVELTQKHCVYECSLGSSVPGAQGHELID